jgi:tetratricopeptide (TPR) repeat protein
VRRRKRRKRVLLGLETLLKAYKNPFEKSIKEAKGRLLLEEYNIVVAITDQILETQPKNHEALLLRALSLEAINYNLESIEDFEMANSIKDIEANNTGLLGLTYKKIGEFEKGQEYLKQSIEKGSTTYEATYNANRRASPLAIEIYKTKTKIPENLLRRNRSEFVRYLNDSHKADLIDGIKKHIHNLEMGIKTYPDEIEWPELLVKNKRILQYLEKNGR